MIFGPSKIRRDDENRKNNFSPPRHQEHQKKPSAFQYFKFGVLVSWWWIAFL
jgi:hypothetical protein